jgi:hypothetical protein
MLRIKPLGYAILRAMKTLRQLHLYLGSLFAPLIFYFCLSGAWQVFRWNDVPKDSPSAMHSVLHELSNPHTHSTLPGRNPKIAHSTFFDIAATASALGMILTALLGVVLAVRFARQPSLVYLCLGTGLFLPLVFLLL